MFNDGAMIALSQDRVKPSPLPDAWNLRNIFISGACSLLCTCTFTIDWPAVPCALKHAARVSVQGCILQWRSCVPAYNRELRQSSIAEACSCSSTIDAAQGQCMQ